MSPAPPHPYRMFLAYFAGAAVGTLFLLAFFLANAKRQADVAAEVAMRNLAIAVETRIDASLRRIEVDLEHMLEELPAAAFERRHLARFGDPVRRDLDRRARLFPELGSYRLFDANGDNLYNSGPPAAAHSVADRAYFQALKANPRLRLYFSEAVVGKITRRPAVVVAKAATDAGGRLLGVAIAALDMGYFTEHFSTLDLGPGGAIALRRIEDGAMVARWPDSPEALNVALKPGHPLQAWMHGGERDGVVRIKGQTDGVERLYVSRRLERYPFFIVSGRATRDYLAPWHQTATIASGFSAVLLLVLAVALHRQWQARQAELDTNRRLAAARDAAEAASRAKSTFLANMSHELRTPMNAIMGLTSLALKHAAEPKLRDQLGKIDQASHHLLAVINDILDISKIEADRLTLERVPFRLGTVLENLVSLIGNKARDKGLRLRVDLPPDVPRLALLGDPLRLGQMLLNFVGNAVKFTDRGAITIGARIVESRESDVLLRFEVVDSGIGIGEEDRARLFTAFEQADGSMTRKYGGTGLGLAITKRMAALMEGEVGVESVPGHGSAFWFTARLGRQIPGAADAVAPAPTFAADSAEARLKARHAGARILLAEDEPVNQEVSREILEALGLRVDLAEDGVAAVDMASRVPYALILMDMQMPNLNGMDATRAIRKLAGHQRTPILAMTANAFDDARQDCLDAGMDDHIGKPIDPPRLFETLLKWLERPAVTDAGN